MLRRMPENGIATEEVCFPPADQKTRTECSSRNLLLVDDDPSILTVLAWNLKDLGLKVVTALGGQGGYKRLCEQRFDILMTDLVMGDLDGLFLVKIDTTLHPEMKVIVMTGSPHLIPRSLPLSYRLDALLEKPFRLDEFKDLITRILGESDWQRRGENETAKPSSAAKILTPA